MTKVNWSRAKRQRATIPNPFARQVRHALRNVSNAPHKTTTDPISIVIGANAPSNTTGQRIIREFQTLAQAHKAGFTWAI